ncbi:MAG: ABC transporter substrate-binding protein [Dehalococcoidia bacterium]|nr:ABC transporter substrate-binding protein [Dehalococcoidia bacterium]
MRLGYLAPLLALFVLPFTALACGDDDDPEESSPDAAVHATPEGKTQYPLTIENCGVKLTFDGPPKKVFTGYHPAFEMVVELGLGDRLTARLGWPEQETTPFLSGHEEVYRQVRELSPDINVPGKEAVVSLGADFMLVESYSSFNAQRGRATRDELASVGTATYINGGWCLPDTTDDYTLETLYQDVLNIGQIFDVQSRAEAVVAEMKADVENVRKRVEGLDRPRVYMYDSGEGPLFSYGKGMSSISVEAAGGDLLFDDQPWYWEASIEAVAASNPDAFVIVDYNPGATGKEKFEFLCTVVPDSKACTEERYILVPAVAFHPGYRNPFIIEEIARMLHPDAFK